MKLVLTEGYGIRLFSTLDLDQVTKINLSCLPENYTHSFFLNLFSRFPKTFVVVTTKDGVVGYIMCRMEFGFSEIQKFSLVKKGHIVSIAVLPEYRNKGLGKALVERALMGMKDYNVREGYLEVRVSNVVAINLYQRLGFEVARKIENYYKDGENAYVMTRKIS
jgi:ribosomal-protein-alanine N-acetyltransferase